MSKARLIERLKWYYPTERFHTYFTVPITLVYLLWHQPIKHMIFISYGLLVCIVILYQGQLYWKLKLERLQGKAVNQANSLEFFRKSKKLNLILISAMPVILGFQLYIKMDIGELLYWGILANVFAILEHVNYYHIQLMIDNPYDLKYLIKNRRLKKASLAKDLTENSI